MKPRKKQIDICNEIAEVITRDLFLSFLGPNARGKNFTWGSFPKQVETICKRELKMSFSDEDIQKYNLEILIIEKVSYWTHFFKTEIGISDWVDFDYPRYNDMNLEIDEDIKETFEYLLHYGILPRRGWKDLAKAETERLILTALADILTVSVEKLAIKIASGEDYENNSYEFAKLVEFGVIKRNRMPNIFKDHFLKIKKIYEQNDNQ